VTPGLPYDAAYGRMQVLEGEMKASIGARNEATTRLNLVDQLLFDCLGWARELAALENYEAGEFADYVLDTQRRLLVVEAKREGTWFELPEGLGETPTLTSLLTLGEPLTKAIAQVEDYAQRRGTPYAAICNGHQLIAFVASRQDGVAPRDGKALVFDSPAELTSRFADLWDLLSPSGARAHRLSRRLGSSVTPPPPRLADSIPNYPGVADAPASHNLLASLDVLFVSDS
jgi:hypothetical protein